MTTALVLLVLTAFVALVVRGLERNNARERSNLGSAPGAVALDRDAERVAGDLHSARPSRRTSRAARTDAVRRTVSGPRPHQTRVA